MGEDLGRQGDGHEFVRMSAAIKLFIKATAFATLLATVILLVTFFKVMGL